MTIVISIAVLLLGAIMVIDHKGWVRTEIKALKNHIAAERDAMRRESQLIADEARKTSINAKGIASNALSSAQRAESNMAKHVATVNEQVGQIISNIKVDNNA